MKIKTWFAIGTMAFTIWRTYHNAKTTVRTRARTGLKRAYKAI